MGRQEKKKAEIKPRKTKYETHIVPRLHEITSMAREGKPLAEIAKAMRVADSTLRLYIKNNSVLREAIATGQGEADGVVEASLFEKCQNRIIKLKKPQTLREVKYKNGKRVSEKQRVKMVEVEEYIPADTQAIIFWMTNRLPDKWQRKVEADMGEDAKSVLLELVNGSLGDEM